VRTALFGLIWITACYSPRVQPGAPCSVDSECPTGQSCVGGFCASPGGQGPDGGSSSSGDAPPGTIDTDKDGIPDDQDNCPKVANNDQLDKQLNEDGDAFGDACDLCPQISDNGADSDGDHIGDACDPDPGTANSIWLYNGFTSGLPAWSRSANWTASNGNVVAMSAGNTDADWEDLVTQFTSAGIPDNFQVTMTVTIQAMTGANGDHSVGIEIWDKNANSMNGAGVDCGLDQDPAGSNMALLLTDDVHTNPLAQAGYPWATGMQYRITMSRHGSTYACSVTGPDGITKKLSGNSNLVPRDGNAIDIWAFGATAQYGSVEIIGRP
jgi:hypothetical protein